MSSIPTEVDVVVAGSGAAGLAAAVTLCEGGATVAVFEKQRSLGGTSNFFHGTFAVESRMQRESYIAYSRDEAFRNIMEYSHWKANARLVRTIVDESAGTIDWLTERGVGFTGQMVNMPRVPHTYHVVKGNGEAIVKTLATRAKDGGVHIVPGTPVTAVLKEGGRISGVMVDSDGQEVEVTCKAVMIATGGYANNKEWLKRYTGRELGVDLIAVGNTGKMGDGIRMAWELGAAPDGVESLELIRVGPVGDEFAMGSDIETVAMQPDLWVTIQGERFCDESLAFHDTHSGNANLRAAVGGYTFSLFDDSVVEHVLAAGVERALTPEKPPGYKPVDFYRELEAIMSTGTGEIFRAGSVEELADVAGMDPTALRRTIDEYNDFCAKGHDDIMAKDPKYLRPLLGPTYYAVRARTVMLGTKGGIKVNERLEVLDTKGMSIPGLYAGGFDAGGMYGDSYPIHVSSGLSSAFALNSGRIAGRNALQYIR
ncbi:MAG: FAD-dependent oxidoreductase [Thermoleophilia bacterium]|nr:FAD-dependent oxidoreductase [Thermoleophilia bacterium]